MGNEKVTKKIGLDFDLDALREAVKKASALIENMGQKGVPPKNLISSFERVERIFDRLAEKTKDGVFKGTDSEYNSLIRDLNQVGIEFNSIEKILTKIDKMDDDALSKFLKKEDLDHYKKASKALEEYYAKLKKIKDEKSPALKEAENELTRQTKNKESAELRLERRKQTKDEKEAALITAGYQEAKKNTKVAADLLKKQEANLAQAQAFEKESKLAVEGLSAEYKDLETQAKVVKQQLAEEFAELAKAKRAFTNAQKFYETEDENGNKRDKTKDYGDKSYQSYQKAEAAVRAAEAKVQQHTDIVKQAEAKLKEKSKAQQDVVSAGELVREATKNLQDSTAAYAEAKQAQEALEESLADTIKEWRESEEACKKATQEIKKYEQAEADAQAAVEAAQKNEEKEKKKQLAQAYADLRKQAEELGIELKALDLSQEYTEESANKLTDAIEEQKKVLANSVRITGKTEDAYKEMGEALDNNREKVDECKEAQEELNEETARIESFEARIKQFLGMAGAVETLRHALRSAFETTKELDAAMTEMAVVTDLEVGDYWDQLPEHAERAHELGISIRSVYEAETLYYQQGLKTTEVQALANETLKMARIAGLSAADATDKMTAALRGFNMELNETNAQKVSDVYSELAAITAADVKEISSAMSKTASIASSAGMEFETTAAFLSQIIETTRESAETAGTAMKTVIARFQELKKSPSEIGEVEGEIVDANAIETALRSVGVSLREANGQFRELDDVFIELSSKWSSLDKNTQRYIATIAAGSRQQSRFIAMMQDYGRTQELVAAANNSAGASQKQYEKTLEGIETKLSNLKTAWEEFSMGILESDLVKIGVDILTKFLTIVNKATEGFDGMLGSITKILTTIALFKIGQKVFDKLKGPMEGFFFDLAKKLYAEGEKGGKEYVGGFKKGSGEASQEAKEDDEKGPESDEPKTPTGNTPKKTTVEKLLNFDSEKYTETTQAKKEQKAELAAMKKEGGDIFARGAKVREEKQKLREIKKDKSKGKDSDEYKDQQKKVEEAEVALENYRKKQDEVGKAAKEQWAVVGQSVQQVGSAVTGLGIGISAIGGILDQLGLEGAGKLMTQIGNGVAIVGAGISFVGTMLSVIPPILTIISSHPIIAIIVAICALIVGTIAIIAKAAKDNSMSARMEKAAKATEQAKEAAEQAKEEYQEIVDTKKGFDEMQESLKSLTKGTKEWKEALRESNEMVMELIAKYPELAKYIQKTESGGLTIAEEGWDTMLANQQRTINNTQSAVGLSQQKELSLKEENLRGDFEQTSKVMRTDSEGNTTQDHAATVGLRNDLKNLYLIQGSSLAEQESQVEAIAKKWDVTTAQVLQAGAELEKNQAELVSIGEQMESIARANLTVVASESVTNSEFGDEAVDAFANSLNSENFENAVNSQIIDLKETSDYKNSEEFQRLAKEYNVSSALTGNYTEDLKTLYAAVTGSEADSDISREEMLTKIAKIDQTNKLAQNMEQYTATLENIAKGGVQLNEDTKSSVHDAKLIAGLLSDDGKDIDPDKAKEFIDKNGAFDRSKVDEIADTYFDGIDKWAEKVGKTTEELYDEIEKNIRDSQKINLNTYQRLNKALGKANGEINKFGTNVSITTQNQKALAEQIISLSQIVDDKTALGVKAMFDQILDSAGDKADMVANILGSTNLNNLTDLEKLPELFENLGIELDNTALEKFINKIKDLGVAIETVDIKKMASAIQNMYDLYASIMSGEQGRDFTQEAYEALVKSNGDLADKFVQVGDVFKYVGGSIGELAEAFALESVRQTEIAKQQLSSQLQVSTALNTFDAQGGTSFGGKNLQIIDGDRNNWSKEEKIAYLEAFRSSALEEDSGVDVETLRYVTGEDGNSLGLSLGTNFRELSDEALNAAINELGKLADSASELSEDLDKVSKDSRIASLTLLDYNINYKNSADGTDKEAATAFGMQAASSGQVAESVIARYNELIAGAEEKTQGELNTLRETMKKGLDRANENIKALNALSDFNNRVAEALYNKEQAKIDKLSQINDSINDTNASILSKMQEKIDEDRAQRELDRAAEDIADKEARLAYLMRDSSGASALEVQALEEEIAADQEGYGDKLVDESLRQLQDANEKAAAQREQQIAIMQAQLDFSKTNGDLQREAERIVKESIDQVNEGVDPLETELGKILTENESLNGTLTPDQLAIFQSGLSSEITNTANAYDALTQEKTTLDSIDSIANDISEWLHGKDGTGGAAAEQKAAQLEDQKKQQRAAAVASAVKTIQKGGDINSSDYKKALTSFIDNDGTSAEFEELVSDRVGKELIKSFKVEGQTTNTGNDWNWADVAKGASEDGSIKVGNSEYRARVQGSDAAASKMVEHKKLKKGTVFSYDGKGYISDGSKAYIIKKTKKSGSWQDFTAFKTGGLADFTGPAWLDGTKSKPEIVLNQTDSANFMQLRDILADILNGASGLSNTDKKTKGGDNYYDIEISVESLGDDYDVEQLAEKIRSMLYDDATYRNVNAINLIR